MTVPPGWSAPSTDPSAPGYTTATQGKVQVTGRTIHLAIAQLGSGSGLKITYGSTGGGGPGAVAPATDVGPQRWNMTEASVPASPAKKLAVSPSITVLSADGSGTLSRATGPVVPGSSGNTVVFVYRAAPGGLQDGTLTLTVPPGWSQPSAAPSDKGFTTASAGQVSVHGRAIVLTHVFLSSGAGLTVIYGSRTAGGPGADAPSVHVGPARWPTAEQTTTAGRLRPLRRG
jgi:hypothetical protein